jgi:hypothetical protein
MQSINDLNTYLQRDLLFYLNVNEVINLLNFNKRIRCIVKNTFDINNEYMKWLLSHASNNYQNKKSICKKTFKLTEKQAIFFFLFKFQTKKLNIYIELIKHKEMLNVFGSLNYLSFYFKNIFNGIEIKIMRNETNLELRMEKSDKSLKIKLNIIQPKEKMFNDIYKFILNNKFRINSIDYHSIIYNKSELYLLRYCKIKRFYIYSNVIIDNILNCDNLIINNLKDLILIDTNLNNDKLLFLSKIDFTNLKHLNLSSNNINNKGIHYINERLLSKLEFLGLEHNMISDEGAEMLFNKKFKFLKTLHLGYNKITNNGFRYFSNVNFPSLYVLNLSGNLIDVGIIEKMTNRLNFVERSL